MFSTQLRRVPDPGTASSLNLALHRGGLGIGELQFRMGGSALWWYWQWSPVMHARVSLRACLHTRWGASDMHQVCNARSYHVADDTVRSQCLTIDLTWRHPNLCSHTNVDPDTTNTDHTELTDS